MISDRLLCLTLTITEIAILNDLLTREIVHGVPQQ